MKKEVIYTAFERVYVRLNSASAANARKAINKRICGFETVPLDQPWPEPRRDEVIEAHRNIASGHQVILKIDVRLDGSFSVSIDK